MKDLPTRSNSTESVTTCSEITHRIGYFLWRFPILSETFIQREIAALQAQGVSCQVFAEEPQDIEFLDARARAMMEQTVYLLPISSSLRNRLWFRSICKQPRKLLGIFNRIRAMDYEPRKSLKRHFRLMSNALVLAHHLREHQVDHIHSPWANHSALIAMLAANLLNIPFTVQARAYELHRENARWALKEKFAGAKRVITNSDYNVSHIRQILPAEQHDKLILIYNGLDLERFVPPVQRTDDGIRILSVGRQVKQKGYEYLLKACAILKREGIAFECRIVGGAVDDIYPGYRAELEKLRLTLGLAEEVQFLGARSFSEVLKEYREADIFVLPCVTADDGARDITPNCLLEAMAMKLPVLSTTTSAIPELVEHEVSGILVAPNSEQALAVHLSELLSNPDRRRSLGEAGRMRVERLFNIQNTAANFIKVFSDVHQPDEALN